MERVDLPLAEYSFEQKLDLLETLWADLAQNDAVLKLPDWHRKIGGGHCHGGISWRMYKTFRL